jgi:putative transcriptional regulator
MDHQCLEGERQGSQNVAKQKITLAEIMARAPVVDLDRVDATTEAEVKSYMREEGYDPDEELRDEDIISPAVIRRRLGMSQARFAHAIHVPLATVRNWEQGRTLMEPSARALMTILAREPEAALRALTEGQAA